MSINPPYPGVIVKMFQYIQERGGATKCILLEALEACLEYVLLSLVLSKDTKFQSNYFTNVWM